MVNSFSKFTLRRYVGTKSILHNNIAIRRSHTLEGSETN